MLLLYKLSLIFALASHGADLASTENCLGAGKCHELNPWLARFNKPVAFGFAKAGVAAASEVGIDHFKETHPKWATALNFGIGATFTGIAIHNAKVAGQ
jgi:hypothetical protein